MNNIFKSFAFLGAIAISAPILVACGDDAKPAATDTTSGTDTTAGTDTATENDTSMGTDTNTQPDVPTPAVYPCGVEERNTFEACAGACQNQPCIQTCLAALSPTCADAFTELASCIQAAGCTEANMQQCIAQNCAEEFEQFYGPIEPPGDCDPTKADACGQGQICTYIDDDYNVGCVPAGTAGLGESCGGNVGCREGACLGDGTTFTCEPFCKGAPAMNTCPDNRPCNSRIDGSDYLHCGAAPTGCSVLAQDCPGNQGCYPINPAGDTTCASHANKPLDAACSALNECSPGLICVVSQNGSFCRTACDPAAENSCTAGTCTPLGTTGIGSCVAN
jgi:hypothetical protein